MSFSGNFQRPNPPIPPNQPPVQSEEEKALAEKKRRFDEDLKKAQADLKRPGRDAFVSSSAPPQTQSAPNTPAQQFGDLLKSEGFAGLLVLLFILLGLGVGFLLFARFLGF